MSLRTFVGTSPLYATIRSGMDCTSHGNAELKTQEKKVEKTHKLSEELL